MVIEMSYAERQLLRKAFEHWGASKQYGMAMEECAETIVALNHHERGRVPVEKLIEEFADAFVCVAQILEVSSTADLPHAFDALEAEITKALRKLKAKLERSDHNYVAGREE